jgi:hypothetical protein
MEQSDASHMIKSKSLFAIRVEVFLMKVSKPAIFAILDGLIVMIYETSKSPVFEPFSINTIKALILGQDFP